MARTSQQVTKAELETAREWLAKNPQYDTTANGESISHYILEVWNETITEYTLNIAVQKLQEVGRLEVLSPVQLRYAQVARQDLGRAEALHDWYLGQKTLAKDGTNADGDKSLENQTALLIELQGRDISVRSIQEAIGRLAYKHGLHFAPAPAQTNPRQHQDSGAFMPKDEANRRYVGGRKNHGQDPQSEQAAPPLSPTDEIWRKLAEDLRGNTHSETARIQAIHGRTWRETFDLRKRELERNKPLIDRMGAA